MGDRAESIEIVAHRAGNDPDLAAAVGDRAHVVELDVHVLYGRVELRHEKVFRPTQRLWERWYVLPRGSRGVPIAEVLDVLEPDRPVMVDLKCFLPAAARRIRRAVHPDRPVIASSRSWWVLTAFPPSPTVRRLRSCRSRWHVEAALRVGGLGDRTGIVVHQEVLDADLARRIRSQTPLLFTWAVPDEARAADLVEWGVTGLIVDDLDRDWLGRE